ncbi:MAG TPA: type II toxin-antitoxin system VapB family antitoxin [Chloroflexota bacterium]|jgi:antitoxin VapB|nr:type II toxin-antitoxin system VapB family antitoxin [Chloroflexota bacterium]
MSLNIKSQRAHELAREPAELTGESMTAAITAALQERLNRARSGASGDLAARLRAVGQDCQLYGSRDCH